MKKTILLLLASAALCAAQDYDNGIITAPDAWGNRHIIDNNGNNAIVTPRDEYGNRRIQGDDGTIIIVTPRDAYGNQTYQVEVPPEE